MPTLTRVARLFPVSTRWADRRAEAPDLSVPIFVSSRNLNFQFAQSLLQLLCIFQPDRVHSEPLGAFQVDSAIINKTALICALLSHFESHAIDIRLRFAKSHKTRTHKDAENLAQMEGFNAI